MVGPLLILICRLESLTLVSRDPDSRLDCALPALSSNCGVLLYFIALLHSYPYFSTLTPEALANVRSDAVAMSSWLCGGGGWPQANRKEPSSFVASRPSLLYG